MDLDTCDFFGTLNRFYFDLFFLCTPTSPNLLDKLKKVQSVDLCASFKRDGAGLYDHVYACVALPCIIDEIESDAKRKDLNTCFSSCQRQMGRGIFGPCIILKYGLNTRENKLLVLSKVGSCPGLYASGLRSAIENVTVFDSTALFVALPTSQNSMPT